MTRSNSAPARLATHEMTIWPDYAQSRDRKPGTVIKHRQTTMVNTIRKEYMEVEPADFVSVVNEVTRHQFGAERLAKAATERSRRGW